MPPDPPGGLCFAFQSVLHTMQVNPPTHRNFNFILTPFTKVYILPCMHVYFTHNQCSYIFQHAHPSTCQPASYLGPDVKNCLVTPLSQIMLSLSLFTGIKNFKSVNLDE